MIPTGFTEREGELRTSQTRGMIDRLRAASGKM
ncbi:hypothetical protein JOD45_000783 [Scopulibacillus daqui]|uniref:Uncharacterized protein n=1 Tax=Scopulibacillus daqui TaxID=1469162 RepID=A0ABS2PY05_9BACL|nr:hypothetical protein [Scopulibacillus daqui]